MFRLKQLVPLSRRPPQYFDRHVKSPPSSPPSALRTERISIDLGDLLCVHARSRSLERMFFFYGVYLLLDRRSITTLRFTHPKLQRLRTIQLPSWKWELLPTGTLLVALRLSRRISRRNLRPSRTGLNWKSAS